MNKRFIWDDEDFAAMTNLSVISNGGQGSGNHGHKGRPGRVGGSGDGKDIAIKMLSKIRGNKRMRRIATGLMADGGIDDVANVTSLVEDKTGYQFSGEEDDGIL